MIRERLAAGALVAVLSLPGVIPAQSAFAPSTIEVTIKEPALDLSNERYQVDMSLRVPPLRYLKAFHFLYVTVDIRGEVGDGNVDFDVYHGDNIVREVNGTYDQAGAFHLISKGKKKRTAIDGTFDGVNVQLIAKTIGHHKPNPTTYTAEVRGTRWDSRRGRRVLMVDFAYRQKGKEWDTKTAYLLPDEHRAGPEPG